jgi:thiol-disulfide isomerase/thioredoxin
MLKKHFSIAILFATIIISSNAIAKNNCTIKASILDMQEGTVFIRNLTSSKIDTILITKGLFSYNCEITEATPFVLMDEANHYQLFFVDPNATINIKLKRKEMQVTALEGSKSQDVFRKLINANEPLQQLAAKLQQDINTEGANKDSIAQVLNAINIQSKNNFYSFLKDNKTSEVSSFVLFSTISNDRNVNTKSADTMYQLLEGKGKTSFYGVELTKLMNKLKAVEVGYLAPDFTLPDSTGNIKHTLSKVYSQNKYVLIDFWASWCGPCKAEIPFLKTAYERFHNKGFEIVSVSLDDKKQAWLAALRQYQMPWIHVSDIKGFKSAVNELYHVPSIPKTLLLDKTGKIIATDLRGRALDLKLEELLKE